MKRHSCNTFKVDETNVGNVLTHVRTKCLQKFSRETIKERLCWRHRHWCRADTKWELNTCGDVHRA